TTRFPPGLKPCSADCNSGRSCSRVNVPRYPPADAVGSIECFLASSSNFSPACRRVSRAAASDSVLTTISRRPITSAANTEACVRSHRDTETQSQRGALCVFVTLHTFLLYLRDRRD